jgi:hypothetical protein
MVILRQAKQLWQATGYELMIGETYITISIED